MERAVQDDPTPRNPCSALFLDRIESSDREPRPRHTQSSGSGNGQIAAGWLVGSKYAPRSRDKRQQHRTQVVGTEQRARSKVHRRQTAAVEKHKQQSVLLKLLVYTDLPGGFGHAHDVPGAQRGHDLQYRVRKARVPRVADPNSTSARGRAQHAARPDGKD